MAEVIARAAELRLAAEPEELILKLEGEYIRVRVREQRAAARRDPRAARHDRRRARALPDGDRPQLLLRVRPACSRARAIRDGEQVEKALKANGYLEPGARARVAGGDAGEARARALHDAGVPRRGGRRRSSTRRSRSCSGGARGWSHADVPLLDEAHALVGEPRAHVRPRDRRRGAGPLADAAPDDRARARGRRADDPRRRRPGHRAGHATRAGRRLRICRAASDAEVEELRHAYRVPREIMELALPLLDTIAPGSSGRSRYRLGRPSR